MGMYSEYNCTALYINSVNISNYLGLDTAIHRVHENENIIMAWAHLMQVRCGGKRYPFF